ncbi:hypothetical protein [Neisseria musculi]|uniref:hypothetical protein n=2 Tax=Neisseria musculi TaxID=1815583 RepID=UPI00164A6C8E|nr:hypothetical protein [Neisseria musculi]
MFFLPAHPRPAGKRPGNAADALPARKGVLTGCGLIPARQPIMTCNSNISIHSAGDAAQPFRIRSVRYRGDRKKKKEKRKKKKEKRKKKKEKRKKKKEKRKKKKEKRKKKNMRWLLSVFQTAEPAGRIRHGRRNRQCTEIYSHGGWEGGIINLPAAPVV